MHLSSLNIPVLAMEFAVLLLSLTVHETAHAWTANRFGDPTARALGRISMNPLHHIDPIGTVLFPLVAMVTGVPLLGWAKPVPVNPLNLRDPRRMGLWISAAGPLSNVALSVLFLLALAGAARSGLVDPFASGLGTDTSLLSMFASVCQIGITLNAMLAVFNLIPVPPLDGAGVLEGILPPALSEGVRAVGPFGFILLYAMILIRIGGLSILGWIFVPVEMALGLLEALLIGG